MNRDDIENLRKFSTCDDQFGDGMTIVPQALLAKAHEKITSLISANRCLEWRIMCQRNQISRLDRMFVESNK